MRLDRKLFLIAPTLVLVLIVAGLFFTASRLGQITEASDGWGKRDAFVSAVEHGKKQLTAEQYLRIVRFSLDAERRRSEALLATRDLLLVLGWMTAACAAILLVTVRRIPRTQPLRGPVLFNSAPGSP